MKAGYRKKKGARAAFRKRMRLLLTAVLAVQMAVSPVMTGAVSYAMEDSFMEGTERENGEELDAGTAEDAQEPGEDGETDPAEVVPGISESETKFEKEAGSDTASEEEELTDSEEGAQDPGSAEEKVEDKAFAGNETQNSVAAEEAVEDKASVEEGVEARESSEEKKLLYTKEAEDAELTNGARISEAEAASGGKMVGYIGTDGGNHEDGTVTFQLAGVSAGSYELRVYYAVESNNDRYFDIYVNGELKETWNQLPGTGSFSTPSETPHILNIDLTEGENTISFGCKDWYAPNLDKIEIYGAGNEIQDGTGNEEPGEPENPEEKKLLYTKEAEDAELTNDAAASDAEAASGGKMVGYIGTDGGNHADGTVTFRMAGVSAGSYELHFYYAVESDNDRYFDIYVNGEVKDTESKLPGTGSFSTPSAEPYILNIDLTEGENTISFGCKDWYAPNLDKIEIYGVGDEIQDGTGSEEPDEPEVPDGQELLYEAEAEDAELTNGAGIKEAEAASGGKLVNYIGTDGGGHADGTVAFTVPDMEEGTYELWVFYAVDGGDRYFDINVNGKPVKTAAYPSTGSFDIPGKTPAKVTVDLAEGENVITFGCQGWYAPNLDRIQIYTVKEDNIAAEGYYEAEDGELGGKAKIAGCADASGGLKVGDIGGGDGEDKGRVTFTVNMEEEGLYEVGVYYVAGDPRPFVITVNGENPVSLACPSSGGWDKVGRTSVDLYLKKGENKITFGSDTWGPDLDRIYVPKEKKEANVSADTRLTLQAEEAILQGSASWDYNSSSCAKGGKVSDIGGDGKGAVLFEGIQIPEAGTYAIDVAYAAKEGRRFLITVDNGSRSAQEIWMDCPAGYDWDVPNRHIVTCELEAGTYSLIVSNPEGYAPNLDEIRIYRSQVYEMGEYTFLYDLETGRYNLIADGRTRLNDAYAAVSVEEEMYRSIDYTDHELTQENVTDGFGKGIVLHSISRMEGCPDLKQDFYLYEGQDYFLTQLEVSGGEGESGTNYIAPLTISSLGGVENEMDGKDYFLRVPYDNDG